MSNSSRTPVLGVERDRFLTNEALRQMLERTIALMRGGGSVQLYVDSTWTGSSYGFFRTYL